MNINSNILNLTERLIPMSIFSKGQGSKIFDDVAKNNNEYIVLKNNEPTAVLISINEYRNLVNNAEKFNLLLEKIDNEELLSLAEKRLGSIKDAISFEELIINEDYTMDGLKELSETVEVE
jgi:prevent-host-death family protein